MLDILLLILGIVSAIFGARWLIDGAVEIAQRFNIPPVIIGAVIIGFGTSFPELTVNIQSAIQGTTGLAIGNILGSNLFNICMILGIVAVISPIHIIKKSMHKNYPICLLSAFVLGVSGNELFFNKIPYNQLFMSDGIIFLCFFSIYMFYMFREIFQKKAAPKNEPEKKSQMPLKKALLFIGLGLVGLIVGGSWIVNGAKGIAHSFGLSEKVIGLLIIGPGTSLPELFASIAAAMRKEADMVIGNVLGSNIFNIFFTLGITSIIAPIPLDLELNTAILLNLGITLFLFLIFLLPREKFVGRGIGIFLLSIYVAYLGYTVETMVL